ncbi:glycosyltransferase family 2 protein [Christiangramia echinicola]|uniref:Glycosyltransferase 2-like domain-containing protein n=1 Tax=Christiangramia echinicola TaxID=279359 RepID=A0A1H1L3L3_9FLAO|nr:glycosyltransferase family A protein [Christiangramia echinicola]SDR68910.1 hypothetical protein SAMN04488552_0522 [Christiangramia echinicola]
MLLLIHNAGKLVRVKSEEEKDQEIFSINLVTSVWKYAEKYPEDLIGWCEEQKINVINTSNWAEVFQNDLIMASYGIENRFLPETLGYIDQLPFININSEVRYPTWLMSSDIGGIKGKTLLKFKGLLSEIKDFNFLINSIARIGQQNGLFCYSDPRLIKEEYISKRKKAVIIKRASIKNLFYFVAQHYNKKRLVLLLWCFIKYEKSFPIFPFLSALYLKRLAGKRFQLNLHEDEKKGLEELNPKIDVIIPTLGRPKYLLQVIEDLSKQSLLPRKVIVVEQNPDKNSQTELLELSKKNWPFKIIHQFIHEVGACNARNLALDETESDWVFFADDDNRMEPEILERAFQEIDRYKFNCLTLHYPQEGESKVFKKMKQWGTFGAGNSIVSRRFAVDLRFDRRFEYGYGEDKDYGMQLRNAGCDIIYHPNIEILHLKAPRGGFREKEHTPWEEDEPKPSPTLMLYAKKYYSNKQLKGFKEELFFRFYFKQKIKNPFKYYRWMNDKWEKSEFWVQQLNNRAEELSKSRE